MDILDAIGDHLPEDNMQDVVRQIIENQQDIDPKFAEALDENFMELIDEPSKKYDIEDGEVFTEEDYESLQEQGEFEEDPIIPDGSKALSENEIMELLKNMIIEQQEFNGPKNTPPKNVKATNRNKRKASRSARKKNRKK